LALQLLADNKITSESAEILPLGGNEAADALINGQLDAAFFIASPSSSVVQELLEAAEVSLMNFERAEAYTRIYRFLSMVRLPRGVIDLNADIPSTDITMIAPTATLVVRKDFHPALIDLLLQAASEVHGKGSLFDEPVEFPSSKFVGLPLSKDAKRYFKYGPPFLQRYMPFWAATLVDRLKVMLLPIVALLFPLFKIMPPTYRWRIRSKIYRWYKELEAMDRALLESKSPEELSKHIAELDRIEDDVRKVSVPLSYRDELYHLRVHIDLVRSQMQKHTEHSMSQ